MCTKCDNEGDAKFAEHRRIERALEYFDYETRRYRDDEDIHDT